MSPSFLPEILDRLMKKGNDIRIDLTACNNEQAQSGLKQGLFDVSFFYDYAFQAEIIHETLLQTPPYLVLPSYHPLAKNSGIYFSDLRGEPIVLLNLPTTLEYYSAMLKRHKMQSNVVIEASSVEMVRSLVASGMGCSILSMRPSTPITYANKEIACVPLLDPTDRILELVIGYMPEQMRLLTSAFIKECNAYFGSEVAKQHSVLINR